MAQNYIGKIAGIVTLNTRDVTKGVNDAKAQLDAFGNSIQKALGDANRRAGKSFDSIFTPVQKLQAALRALQSQSAALAFPKETIDRANNLARAVESLFSPIKRANEAFQSLGLADQGRLQNELNKTLQVVSGLAKEVNDFGAASDARFLAAEERVRSFAAAVQAASDAEIALQNDQKARLSVANTQLPVLQRESSLISADGAATDIRARLAAQVEVLNKTQQEAAFRERNAELAERELRAIQAMSEAQNKFINAEFRRRDGTTQRQAADAFDDNAAGIRTFSRTADTQIIGVQEKSVESLTARVRQLNNEFQRLPTEVQQELAGMAARLNEVANGAQRGTVGIGIYEETIDRLESRIRAYNDAQQDAADKEKQIAEERKRAADNVRKIEDARADAIVRQAQQIAKAEQKKVEAARRAQTGDINTRGARRNTLAFQQLIFAVDDAASVTGGLEQRLRAAGNNLTQFGVLVGGTAGLVGALAAVLGTQAVLAIAKFTGVLDDAESRAKAFKSTLEQQKQAAEGVGAALAQIASLGTKDPFSELTRGAKELEAALRQLEKRQRDALVEERLGTAEGVQVARTRLATAEKEFEGNPNARNRQARDIARQRLQALEVERRRDILAGLDDSSSAQGRRETGTATAISSTGRRLSTIIGQLSAAAEAGIAKGLRGVNVFESLKIRLSEAEGEFTRAEALENGPERRAAVRAAQESIDAINREIDAKQGNVNAVVAATQALLAFQNAIDLSAKRLIDTVADESRSRAEQATREANVAEARRQLGIGSRQEVAVAASAEVQARKDAEAFAEIQRKTAEELVKAGADFEKGAIKGEFGPGLRDAAGRLSQAALDLADANAKSDIIARDDAQRRIDRERQVIADAFKQTPLGRQLEFRANEADIGLQRSILQRDLEARGRDLQLTAGDRVARQLRDDEAALLAAGGPNIEKNIARIRDEALSGIAPTLFGLQDQVQNAILRGPSRAALNPTDVSTVEGSRELTRLLRGDDEARNQDLVAINKEQLEVQKAIRDNLDLRNAN